MVIDPNILQHVSVELARRYTLIPIFMIGKTLTIAMADPLNIIAIDEIKYQTGLNIKRAITTIYEINDSIEKYYSISDSLSQIIHETDEPTETTSEETSEGFIVDSAETDSPIVTFVNIIISKAVRENASDVHIEPGESRIRIRYRISGVMREEASPPKSMQSELISRIKVAADLDVSEKRLPQDGRFLMSMDGRSIDLRVSTLPTIHGEKIVIRILDRKNLSLTFNQLGISEPMEKRWKNIIQKPEGLILISGPTSSGKTSTLYATLQHVNTIEKNIVTVEDPVEYSLPLITQVQINEKSGLTFPSALRSLLRQNPDTIMIGEIRDSETASMAIRSSLTGHLVFTTIHTNDAPSAVTRLVDMGIENYLVASAVKGVLAQRLVRTNCPNCTEEYVPLESLLEKAGLLDISDSLVFKKGAGCPKCRMTGYAGLTGIYEYFEINPVLSELVLSNASLHVLREEARKYGFVPLFEMGLKKIATGQICLEELLKETSNIDAFEVVDTNVQEPKVTV